MLSSIKVALAVTLLRGHLETELVVAEVLHIDFLTILIQNGEGLKREALVRRDSDGHGDARGSGLLIQRNCAVLGLVYPAPNCKRKSVCLCQFSAILL